jgi:inositol-hexakisphosphate 5-kinase
MVLKLHHWMDETTTNILTQSNEISLSKFHHSNEPSQFPTIFSTSHIPSSVVVEHQLQSITDNNNRLNNCASLSTPKKNSISSVVAASNPLNEFLRPHSILSQNNSSESDDDDDDEQSKKEEINLYPLSNQVGGHTRLLLLNDKTVIKPLNIRELEFYQNIPGNDIQHFVPKYKGM